MSSISVIGAGTMARVLGARARPPMGRDITGARRQGCSPCLTPSCLDEVVGLLNDPAVGARPDRPVSRHTLLRISYRIHPCSCSLGLGLGSAGPQRRSWSLPLSQLCKRWADRRHVAQTTLFGAGQPVDTGDQLANQNGGSRMPLGHCQPASALLSVRLVCRSPALTLGWPRDRARWTARAPGCQHTTRGAGSR